MSAELKKTLSPIMLWGLGVGYVISGMYFGWNLGLKEGGTFGMGLATMAVIIMYVCFSFSYSELACAIPKAGGAFDYATRALGKDIGFIAGIVQAVEFIFAPPAIAFGIGAYFHLLFPYIPVIAFATAAYILFTALNIYGVKAAASFEFFVTIIAMSGLFLFCFVTAPHFSMNNFTQDVFPKGLKGAFAALPFAIWFFLGIEGVANVAEESINPQKDIIKGFGSAILTLVALCVLTFIFSVGVGGWQLIVFDQSGALSDSPLPLAAKSVTGENSLVYKLVIAVGTFGLIASFHGLLLAAGRATFELGRVGYAPGFLGAIHPRFQTPYAALISNMVIGILALLTGKTGEIIIISVFGALVMYIISMFALIVFRIKEPQAIRPFKVPLYPLTPILALITAFVFLAAMIVFYWETALVFFLLLLFSFVAFKYLVKLPLQKITE
ncbi:MAG: ethanolamine permease [Cytophagaceae bacterium]